MHKLKYKYYYTEEILKEDLRSLSCINKICNTISLNCMKIAKAIAENVLAATIDNHKFNNKGMKYLMKNKVNISIDAGFISENITHLIWK